MAKYSLSNFFAERQAHDRRDIEKAITAAVTGPDRRAVLAMFRAWHPSADFSNVAFRRHALSKPAPLTRGKINPNVTRVRKALEDLAYDRWQPFDPDKSGIITIPLIPGTDRGTGSTR